MSVAPLKLQSITANRFDILQHNQHWHIVTPQLPHASPFVDAGCAGAIEAKVSDRIDTMMPVAPLDPKHSLVEPGQIFWFK
jgi:hypothetical protein